MKRKYRILTVAMLILIGLSCSDNDKKLSNRGRISFYGETFPLEQGAIYHGNNHFVAAIEDYTFEDRYEGEEGEQIDQVKGYTAEVTEKQTGNFLIGLYEDRFVISELTQSANGQGACICIYLASPEPDKIAPGKYTYSLNHDKYTFKGYSSANYDSKEVSQANELTEGEVEISQEGDIYTITFKCKTNFGGPIEGSYTGNLKSFNIRENTETVNFVEDIRLKALFEEVDYADQEDEPQSEPDYLRGMSFFQSSSGDVYSADLYKDFTESARKGIDIALAYDAENKSVYFESPIKMRALLWHNTFENEDLFDYSFDLPCHTKYMPAPPDFTDADFEALSALEDFIFDFSEAEVSIPIETALPYFVFVQTGNGLQGVIQVKEISPESTEMIGGITYPVNPSILMDVKFPRSFSEQQIR